MAPRPIIDPAELVIKLRCHLNDLSSSAAFLLQARAALDTELAAGGDGLTLLAAIEQETSRYAAAQDVLRELAPAIDRLLTDIHK